MNLPLLRPIEIYPTEKDGQTFFCLRDQEGYIEEQAVLSHAAAFVACMLDGQNDFEKMNAAFKQAFNGQELRQEDVEKVVAFLDDKGFLLTPNFKKIQQNVDDNFIQNPNRPAFLAKKSYPEDSSELKELIDSFFNHDDGPKELPDLSSAPSPLTSPTLLISPHIDFHRGGHSYAHAYLHLYKRGKPKTVFIFGVAHFSPPSPFVLTKKNFETPFGTLKTNQEIVDRLAAACPWDAYTDEKLHRTEHSIEFQAVMLAYLFGTDVEIVPILCGAFQDEFNKEEAEKLGITVYPMEELNAFLSICQDEVNNPDNQAMIIAGADLAHVGKRFGDEFDINDDIIKNIDHRDRNDLGFALNNNAKGFYDAVMEDKNERRVCGKNCIYSALKAFEKASVTDGQLLHYGYAHDPAGGIVSFTSILL